MRRLTFLRQAPFAGRRATEAIVGAFEEMGQFALLDKRHAVVSVDRQKPEQFTHFNTAKMKAGALLPSVVIL